VNPLAFFATIVLAGTPPDSVSTPPSSGTMTAIAGRQYAASGFHCWIWGADYRRLWTTPIKVEVLDFSKEAGGLRVSRKVGGRETKALAIVGRDGRNYTFRGIQKDASSLLGEDLQGTYAEHVLQDQMAGQHPASEVVVRGLLDAVDIPCPDWRLVILPDDPVLGKFQKEYAGMIGMFGVYPSAVSESNPGFRGITEIIRADSLYQLLEAGRGDRVDSQALLKARIMDLLIGDWDRHRKQWRWAKFPGSPLWTPIPEDRDQAFCRYEGLALIAGRDRDPRFQNFGPKYRGLDGLTSNGSEQDRQLLSELSRADFERTAAALQVKLTDPVIDHAVDQMPEEWRAIDGPRLAHDLKARRDGLRKIADAYYLHLAQRVDVRMSQRPELIEAVRRPHGDLDVSVRYLDQNGDTTFHRVLHSSETKEVRLYAMNGDDRFVVTGGKGPIKIRAVGGPGNDTLDDHQGGDARLSDSEGTNTVVKGPGTSEDSRPYVPPPPPADAPWIPPRDFGRDTWSSPRIGYGTDPGVVLGWALQTRGYGFRKNPYADRQTVLVDYAFAERSPRFDYQGEFRRENRASWFGLHARFLGSDVLHFYGLGNNTTRVGSDAFYQARERRVLVNPFMTRPLSRTVVFTAGPLLRWSRLDRTDVNLVNAAAPYGSNEFGQLGIHGELTIDSRDRPTYPRRGVLLGTRGTWWPKLWDVSDTFGEVDGNANTYLSLGNWLTLAARAGGKKVFGTYPFRDAAFIGGGNLPTGSLLEPSYAIRGFHTMRFAGDASAYGNADLRLRLFRATIILPTHVGVFGLADAGRVWLSGEDSNTWHRDFGGGVWISPMNYRYTFVAYIANSSEGNIVHVGSEFTF